MTSDFNKCVNCSKYSINTRNCSVFTITDEITGETTEVSASQARSDEEKCGIWGQLFDPT